VGVKGSGFIHIERQRKEPNLSSLLCHNAVLMGGSMSTINRFSHLQRAVFKTSLSFSQLLELIKSSENCIYEVHASKVLL
jgi:hypothetical protein